MTDKPKTIQEALAEVQRNAAQIKEQQSEEFRRTSQYIPILPGIGTTVSNIKGLTYETKDFKPVIHGETIPELYARFVYETYDRYENPDTYEGIKTKFIPDGWTYAHTKSQNFNKSHLNLGMYVNMDAKKIVFSLRGTDFYNITDILRDFEIIIKGLFGAVGTNTYFQMWHQHRLS